MIYAPDKITPGMANDDTLLYGVEVADTNLYPNAPEPI